MTESVAGGGRRRWKKKKRQGDIRKCADPCQNETVERMREKENKTHTCREGKDSLKRSSSRKGKTKGGMGGTKLL